MLRVQVHWLASVCRGYSCHGNWAARLRSHWGDDSRERLVGLGRSRAWVSWIPVLLRLRGKGHPQCAAGQSVALLGLNCDQHAGHTTRV